MLPPPLPTSSSASVSKFARPFVLHEHITSTYYKFYITTKELLHSIHTVTMYIVLQVI